MEISELFIPEPRRGPEDHGRGGYDSQDIQ